MTSNWNFYLWKWIVVLKYMYFVVLCDTVDNVNPIQWNIKAEKYRNTITDKEIESAENSGCVVMDGICIAYSDITSYEAIKALHAHLDDDQSGDIDISESVDFLREELNYTKGLEKRQKAFHHNNDQHISVQELWNIWLANEVHNWTVDQTVGWLQLSVELDQYVDAFYENAVNGSMLPRLATNNDQFSYRILGIKNPTHRSKISIKAMDIVLFGPPKETGSLVKDVFIASLIFVIVILLFKFNRMSRTNNSALRKMDQDMEALQEELLKFHEEKRLQEENSKRSSPIKNDKNGIVDDEMNIFDSEKTSWDLGAESYSSGCHDWESNTFTDTPPDLDLASKNELQLWLQLTYEKERLVLENKMQTIKSQIEEAKEMCNKLKPNRKNLFGALSFVHGKMEAKGQPIMEARAAFAEIQSIDKEMEYRWGSVERLLGFSITQNGGIEHLRCILEPQASLAHSSNSAVGLPSASIEKTADVQANTVKNKNPSEEVTRRKYSSLRGVSVLSDVDVENNPHFSSSSTHSHRSTIHNFVRQSHTVDSGLSAWGSDDCRPSSSCSESKLKHISDGNYTDQNGVKNCSGGHSTDDANSAKFTLGENNTIILDNCSVGSGSRNTPPHSPTMQPLHRMNKDEARRTPSDKSINKFSSEPSLDIEETKSVQGIDQENSKSVSKKGILGRARFFSKLKSKSDKNK